MIKRFMLFVGAIMALVSVAHTPVCAEDKNALPPQALSRHALGNYTYACGLDNKMSIPLRNGTYSHKIPYLEGHSATVSANLVEAAWGHVSGAGDTGDAAAVVYVYNTGGTGYFYQLTLLGLCRQQPCELACTPLGDRIQLLELDISDQGNIVAKLVTHGEDDPACCPSKHVTKTWQYKPENNTRGELVANTRGELVAK